MQDKKMIKLLRERTDFLSYPSMLNLAENALKSYRKSIDPC